MIAIMIFASLTLVLSAATLWVWLIFQWWPVSMLLKEVLLL
jgi:hypothetical protein